MAVPKKKNKKVKFKYSVIKKQYKNEIKEKIMFCTYCNIKKKNLTSLNIISKKKICVDCIYKILKKKKQL